MRKGYDQEDVTEDSRVRESEDDQTPVTTNRLEELRAKFHNYMGDDYRELIQSCKDDPYDEDLTTSWKEFVNQAKQTHCKPQVTV